MKYLSLKILIIAGIISATLSGCTGVPLVGGFASPSPSSSQQPTPVPTAVPSAIPDHITISYLNVGQGDSELIQTPHGQTILIDAGLSSQCSQVVEPFLQKLNVKTIDLFVISHPHADHYGSASLFQAAHINQVWEPGVGMPSYGFTSLLAALSQFAFEKLNPRAGYSANLDGTQLEVVAPENPLIGDDNNDSIAFRMTFNNNRFLFPGDAELDSWGRMIKTQGEQLKSDVLKVAHHGSRNGTSQDVLNSVLPRYAIISCGKDNTYGHPHVETVDLLKNANIQIYRTDEEGTIQCRSDGNTIQFSTDNHPAPEFALPTSSPIPSPVPTVTVPITGYIIGNKSSHVFHSPSCRYVSQISAQNRMSFSSGSEALSAGYRACSVCGG